MTGITNNRDNTRSQTYTYDALNRVATAQTASTYSTSAAHCWGESFNYDSWANLLSIGVSNTAYNGCTQENLSVSTATNNQIPGFCYDAAGNLLAQGSCPGSPPYTYNYNAENQLTSTAGVTYTYDGDGERVEKSNGMIYWYGSSGQIWEETDLSGSLTSEYVFFGGLRVARRDSANNVYYYLPDHLGTTRGIAEIASGQSTASLCYDADYYPFGGERAYTNTCSQNYKFTGKERDPESGLDNFGARYDSSQLGRFMSADDPFIGWHLEDPQSLNLYSYVQDNPLNDVDPTGHDDLSEHVTTTSEGANNGPGGGGGINVATTGAGLPGGDAAPGCALNAKSLTPDQMAKRKEATEGKDTQQTPQNLAAQVPPQVKAAIADSVRASNSPTADDKKGGFHEESGIAGTDESGKLVISPEKPGPYSDPEVTNHAHTSAQPVDQNLANSIADVTVNWHVHPSGVTAKGRFWNQPPGPDDYRSAVPGAINIVVGARDKTVYFYDNSRTLGHMSSKKFMGGP